MAKSKIEQYLADDGLFASRWDTFEPRGSQRKMAQLLESCLDNGGSIAIEAPSGSGKTVGYLLPVLLQDKPAIIATGSRYLQRQLTDRDIPMLLELLGVSKSVVLLQGRRHYFCPFYARDFQNDSTINPNVRQQIKRLSRQFLRGWIGEFDELTDACSDKARQYASCDADDCLAKSCPQYQVCPFYRTYDRALEADLVVANHSVLFYELKLTAPVNLSAPPHYREFANERALLNARVVVVDEAHRFAANSAEVLGMAIASGSLRRLCEQLLRAIKTICPEQKPLQDFIQQAINAFEAARSSLPAMWPYRRAQHLELIKQWTAVFARLERLLLPLENRDPLLERICLKIKRTVVTLEEMTNPECLCWAQAGARGFYLKARPAMGSQYLNRLMARCNNQWIFTSATLGVAGRADFFLKQLGLAAEQYFALDSEINYQKQALLYLPEIQARPGEHEFYIEFIAALKPLLEEVGGRVLVLFNSYQALEEVRERLVALPSFPILYQRKQGKAAGSQYALIEQFRSCESAILLATGSFWEGLDLSGLPLSAVVIDKLPFAAPDDPLLKLQASMLTELGVDVFEQYTLPNAVIRFRQGCGRLLRHTRDRGVIMVADRRLRGKAYGVAFMQSLPDMRQVHTAEQLRDSWQHLQADMDATG